MLSCFCCSFEIMGIATILSPNLTNCSGTLKWSENFCICSTVREPKLSSVKSTTMNVTVLIPQSAVQGQTFQLAFLVAD